MPRTVAPLVAAAVLRLLTALPAVAADRPDPAASDFFETSVRPVLAERCLPCHGPEKQKGGLRLDSREAVLRGGDNGPAVSPGEPATSLLIEAVGYEGDTKMPPKGKLDEAAVRALRRWVETGASWPGPSADGEQASKRPDPKDHWAFRPVRPRAVPAVKDESWPLGTIDRFLLAKMEERGLRPVEPADRPTWLRRATFDLAGLPPTPAEVEAFAADDSPGAYERVVDRLLASPRYGERWGRHWLDVARYGEDQAHTFEARMYPYGHRYRDWVVKALNDDMPYDRFVTEQIAGDLLDGPDRDARLPALGFFALGPVYYGKAKNDELDDRVDTLSRGFLGLTVACARCHDHKFDPIPTEDYYALAGVFASTDYWEYPDAPKDVIEAFDRGQAAVKVKAGEVDAFLAISAFRGFYALPVKGSEKSLPKALKGRLKALRDELAASKAKAPKPYPVVHSLAEGKKPANLRVLIRGNPQTPGDEARRRFLTALSTVEPAEFRQGSGRLELAREVTRADNPLTARVIVNRVWEHHFGRGLVATPSNFGTLGEPPSHPELLDHLAGRLLEIGWSLKALHREILLSAAYRASSRLDPADHDRDAENIYLWRMNRRRLEVEPWRDAMLAVSGELDDTLGGPSVDLGSIGNRRRTVYASVSRHDLNALLRLFDFPDPNITCDRRAVTSVPLQQLFVLNSEFMVRQAKALAGKLTADRGESDDARVRRAFPLLFGRPAEADEVGWGVDFLSAASAAGPPSGSKAPLGAWEQYAQALLGSNEFLFID